MAINSASSELPATSAGVNPAEILVEMSTPSVSAAASIGCQVELDTGAALASGVGAAAGALGAMITLEGVVVTSVTSSTGFICRTASVLISGLS
ncbi:MAG: Uncharacterised protein [Marine Group II euryarchaeote MED-G33]|nr:MAG: Uncharacterised protein [Marine Group II euryarchaeote MED-G33]